MAGQYLPVLYDAFACFYSVYEWKIMAEVEMYDHQEEALLHIQNYSSILYHLMLSYTISYSNFLFKIFMDYLPFWIATYRFESISVFLLFAIICYNGVPSAPTGNKGGERLDDMVNPIHPFLAPWSHSEHPGSTRSTDL